jgi:hypothetical protein
MRRGSTVLLLLSSCAPAAHTPQPQPTAAPIIASAPLPTPEPSAGADVPAEPARVEIPLLQEPQNVACRFTHAKWSFGDLRLSSNGKPFASVQGAPTTLSVPVGDELHDAVARFDGNATIRLIAPAKDLSIFSKGPHALLGIVTPFFDTRLEFGRVDTDAMEVSFDAGEVLASPVPLRETLHCADLGIVAEPFDARSSITKRKNLPKRWTKSEGVGIAAVRAGPAVATLRDGTELGVLEMRGGQVRVLAEGPNYVVSGWVNAADLSTNKLLHGGYGYGTGRGEFAPGIYSQLPSCAHELRLFGEIGTERAEIGSLHAGTAFALSDAEWRKTDPRERRDPDRLVEVRLLETTWLHLAKDAHVEVLAAELESCWPQK